MDDRYHCRRNDHICLEFIASVRRFFNYAFSIDENVSRGKIRCPCVRCKNQKFLMEKDVYKQPRTFINNKSKKMVVSIFYVIFLLFKIKNSLYLLLL